MKIQEVRTLIDNALAEKRVSEKAVKTLTKKLETERQSLDDLTDVQNLFQSAVKIMYDSLSAKLSDIVTEGLSIVFPDSGYRFKIEFVEKRNGVEAEMYIEDNDGHHYHPTNDVGGGVADLVGLVLRITYVLLSGYAKILISDEPLRFVDRERIPQAVQFLKKISEDFNLTMLIISHIPEIVAESDTVYKVTKKRGVSTIKLVDV